MLLLDIKVTNYTFIKKMECTSLRERERDREREYKNLK